MKRWGVWLCLTMGSMPVLAASPAPEIVEAQKGQVESLRGEVASQMQLQACDLLDELVFGWTQKPVFANDTLLVMADVRVPLGFGTGLEALLENHLTSLLLKNPRTHMTLAHCPSCTASVVHSGSKGTVITRGVDNPAVLEAARALSGSRHALFLDFEAEGSALVLRARIAALETALPVVYAKTLSTSTSSPALLRSAEHLKSATEARQEYLDLLQGRSLVLVPIRFGVRTYAVNKGATQNKEGNAGVAAVPPFVWLQGGAEIALTQARAWTASFLLGISWLPDMHLGGLAQARIARLLSGSVSSLTHPDLYAFFGGSVMTVRGKSAAVFRSDPASLADLIALAKGGEDLHATFGTLQLGLELRVKNRIGFGFFLEAMPSMSYEVSSLGSYLGGGRFSVRALGTEVSFCF